MYDHAFSPGCGRRVIRSFRLAADDGSDGGCPGFVGMSPEELDRHYHANTVIQPDSDFADMEDPRTWGL